MIIDPYRFNTTGADLKSSLLAWWEFEENDSGSTFADAHGSNPLTIISSETTSARSTASGKHARASSWPNATHSSACQIPRSNTAFDKSGPFAFGAWFYFAEMPDNDLTRFLMGRIGGTGSQQNCYYLALKTLAASQQFQFSVRSADDSFSTAVTTGVVLVANTWYFTVWSFTGSEIEGYTNALPVSSTAHSAGVQSAGDSNFSIANGRRADTTMWDTSRTVGMRVDSAFVLNRAITEAEVAYLYNAGAGRAYAQV